MARGKGVGPQHGNPLNPVAMRPRVSVRAARPTASSTFSGYRYVPAGNLGFPPGFREKEQSAGGRAGEEGLWREGARERKRRARGRSEAREEHQGAAAPRSRPAEERRGPRESAPTSLGARQRLARGARA